MSKNKVKSEIIPYDVVEDILACLPDDSLIRFKSLNKSFSSLIKNPTFVSKQLHCRRKQSRSGFDHAVILLPGGKEEGRRRNNIFFLESTSHGLVNWDSVANESCPSMLDDQLLQIVGHCDGLICFSFESKCSLNFPMWCPYNFVCNLAFSLWNPVLRQHKPLPVSRILPEYRGIYIGNNYLGFGHDPQSHDYKIIRLAFYYKYFRSSHFTRAEVYSLRSNSWRPLPQTLHFVMDQCPHSRASVCSGGFCYWVVQDNLSLKILSFDMSNEVFRLMDLPEWVPQLLSQKIDHSRLSDHFVVKPMVWNKYVCVVAFPQNNVGTKSVDVWVLGRIDHLNLDPNYTTPIEKFSTIQLDRRLV